jgi:dTDP-4-amino-4,6-dideoxygalactose transaminase
MDPEHVAKLITNRTRAIIAVNWGGRFADYQSLKKFGVPVIEDAAHNWDVFLDQPVERGDYICYSFQAIKFLTTADGGILICPEHTEAEARILRWYGLDRTKNESFRCTQNITKVGFKYHMNDVNATIGIENLPYAYDSVMASRSNSQHLCDNVSNPLLTVPDYDPTSSYWLFSMHVQAGLKDHFIKYLENNGISSSPVHFRNDLYDSTIHFQESQLPGVDSFTDTQICIPNGWWVSKQDLDHITETLNKYTME